MTTTQSYSDELADETSAAAETWPDDWPALTDPMRLHRRARADMLDMYARYIEQVPTIMSSLSVGAPASDAKREVWDAYAAEIGAPTTKAMTKTQVIQACQEHQLTQPENVVSNIHTLAAATRLAADLVDGLRGAAVDEDAFMEWADTAPDLVIVAMFSTWARKMRLGEG